MRAGTDAPVRPRRPADFGPGGAARPTPAGSHFCHRPALALRAGDGCHFDKGAYIMQRIIRAVLAAFLVAAAGQVCGTQFAGVSLLATSALAQDVKQIKLTEKQVQSFIAAQKDVGPILEKIQGATSDQLDPKLQAQL